MAVGGDIIEITFNHPTVGSGVILPKANEDSTYDLGGFRSNDDANMVAGNGEMIDQMNRVRWFIELVIAWDMNVRGDLEKLVELAESPVEAEWTITNINGTVYGGTGKPVGDMQGNGNAATFTLKVSGGNKLKKIVG
ncbi:hypothetical protein LCGC14_0716330 [marine sediment metagenome]|uniref:Uncharacterized protein n=1 Tax=marine sediment metagenome TaxID=412755 RepID=A0A0F9QI13_9ZZZZ